MITTAKSENQFFHGYGDATTALGNVSKAVVDDKKKQWHEADVTYRFFLHQHPFVQELVESLLRHGTAELQAWDTRYKGGAVPGSIKVTLVKDAKVKIAAGSQITLTKELSTGLAKTTLGVDGMFRLGEDIDVMLPKESRVTLISGLETRPEEGAQWDLKDDTEALLVGDTRVTLGSDAVISLSTGTQPTVPAGTDVVIAAGTLVKTPQQSTTRVELVISSPLPELYKEFFDDLYSPNEAMVRRPYPVKDLDFTTDGAYSVYNWELFYHVPFTLAVHLSKNQRFAEAHRWFHYLFDPTDDSDGPTPDRFWKVRPFHCTDVKKIEEILVNLVTHADGDLYDKTISSIDKWRDAPFRPHLVARYRQQAYMYKTVMAYLDNVIAWGDSLFRQDTGEAIDEALQLYVLAANILGPRPQAVPRKATVRPQTYAHLRQDLKAFGTAMTDIQSALPFDCGPFPSDPGTDDDQLRTIRSLERGLYFCVPRNDKLLAYWDTVADRLFKIRNSLNLQGLFRQVPLFEPPIDPALLARAVAAGLDVGAIVNGLNQPLPLVRFQLLAQKAAEIAQEVKSLGNSLLVAMEKEDGEALAILRAKHERAVMEMVERVKYAQHQEAGKSREGLLKSLELAVQRYTYYEQQLGKETDDIAKAIPQLSDLDTGSLDKMKCEEKEPDVSLRIIEVDIAEDLLASGGKIVSSHERKELQKLGKAAVFQIAAGSLEALGGILAIIPQFEASAEPMGCGAGIDFGGQHIHSLVSSLAAVARTAAGQCSYEASEAAKIDAYARRERDWTFQSNLAAGEIAQIYKQLRAAQIREAIAHQELKNHRQQMKHAEEIERFLNEEGTNKKGKKTNKALYVWMKREVKGLYGQVFQFAFDIAKKAERALQHELGNPELSYLQFGYLAGKEGLLAGEKLYLDLKRMEMAYHDQNQREYELTKHVSLLQVDPLALIRLRTTGRCIVRLPESLFDMDGPGHYFRRIKTVAMSIPCVSGPYASINCTLTLLKSSIRKTPVAGEQYARVDAEDERFSDYFGSLQSIVTSGAQNDSGLFETNLRDERYLPFENAGAISEWQLQLPADPSKNDPALFDYSTVSDVILHLRYTAREGGGLLRKGAITRVKELITEAQAVGSVRLFSVRHEFPSEWAKFKNQTPPANKFFALSIKPRTEHYPFWSHGGLLTTVTRLDILGRSKEQSLQVADQENITVEPGGGKSPTLDLVKDPAWGNLFVVKLPNAMLTKPSEKDLKLFFNTNNVDDLWIAVSWK